MLAPMTLEFSSRLKVSPEEAWRWITSAQGISAELWPYLRMSWPKYLEYLDPSSIEQGGVLFRSTLYLFGVIPVDYSDLTLLSIEPGRGFVEQSPMGSMRLWRHERWIEPVVSGCTVHDRLTFEPRLPRGLTLLIVARLFAHRHAVLKRRLDGP